MVLEAISNTGRTAQLKRVVSVYTRFICVKQIRILSRPEGAYAKCGVLRTHTGEVCINHLGTLYFLRTVLGMQQ